MTSVVTVYWSHDQLVTCTHLPLCASRSLIN